ncbi:lipase member H-A isoform X1 [Bactrocera neohumeralis]|uniref:lipase member H-A isoform X1 n=1 Tax=Bactrocera neohumeralis TaxID=98809 RepID=UPI002165A745|nr:lipase member H-A isoform X1 [Bactrocera neohumeralis]
MKFSLALLLTFCFVYREAPAIIFNQMDIKSLLTSGALDLNVLRCFLHNKNICPSPYIMYRLYSPKSSRHGIALNIHNPLTLFKGDFNPHRETAFIVHGFNGTAVDVHLQFLKDAYLSRDFNVITVDWRPLTRYPCYLHALINTRLTAQCTAQVYSFLTHHGAAREKITCIGHSLGAHICGMISNHLSIKQHRIIGLDPARPLIERKKNHIFRLSIDDASVIQVIHTNAGFLGQEENIGHLNYCINGGRFQPFCKGNPIRRSRCSHFLSICFLASAMFKHKKFVGVSCPNGCKEGSQHIPVSAKNPFGVVTQTKEYNIGNDAPDDARGCYCIDMPFVKHCPFND